MDKTRGSLHIGPCANLWVSSHLRLRPLLALPAPPTGAALYLQSTGQGRPAAPESQDNQLDFCSEQPQQRLGCTQDSVKNRKERLLETVVSSSIQTQNSRRRRLGTAKGESLSCEGRDHFCHQFI
ncbi:hypothetical protein HJG60_007898 [Phyllostomus discolor]|uniref:Uncharacterized protein n=1 Tax=Phyllostomus discolor TaxID=89673 RepID=A0A834BMW5_9CHIR|nr:hypothetical protein HJG60_007898 [Phyllostomus discolor]